MKIITLFICLSLIGAIIATPGCKKDKETGHLNAVGKLPATYSNSGCCSDPTIPISDIAITIKTEQGTTLKTVGGTNNSTFDCGELNPGNYTANVSGKYTMKYDQSGYAPCGDCGGGTATYKTNDVAFQIIANEDQTITCQ